MNSNPEQFRPRTRTELFLEFLRARFLSIVAVLAIGSGIALMIGLDPELPRWVKLAVFTTIAFVPLGFVFGNWLVGLLHEPNYQYLVDLDAVYLDGAIYQLPPEDFRELEITDEDGNPETPYDMTQLSPNLYVAKNVDLEELTCVGTWRGTLDDRELLRALGKIKECRGMLQEDAQRGWAIENSSFSIVRRAAQDEVRSIADTFAEGTLATDGASISNAVDTALEDHGFEANLDALDDIVNRSDESSSNGTEPEQTQGETTPEEVTTNGPETPEQPQ